MGSVATFLDGRSSESDGARAEISFSDRVWRLLDRIDCRLAESDEEREAIFRLRYSAYMRDGTITAKSSETFSDPFDETGNVYIFGMYIDDVLASSVRIHVASKEQPDFPSLEVFPEFLQPEIDAGKVLVDPTRFVTDENLARLHRGLPYATLRIAGMAAHHFNAEHLLAAVREEHQAFYRRIFSPRLICGPRPYPHLAKPISLMTINYPTIEDEVYRRFPFFRSTFAERRLLFQHVRSPLCHGEPNRTAATQHP